jgi:phage virion morphogenesis protein
MLQISSSGFRKLQRRLTRIEEAVSADNLLPEIAELLLDRTRDRFQRGVDPDGTPWPKSASAARRERAGQPGGTLFNTGALYRSIHAIIDSDRVVLTSSIPYAREHQRGEKGQVKRRFLGFSSEDASAVDDLVGNLIKAGLK